MAKINTISLDGETQEEAHPPRSNSGFPNFKEDYKSVCAILANAQGQIVDYSANVLRLLQYNNTESCPSLIFEIFPAFKADEWNEFFKRTRKDKIISFISEIIRKSGKKLTVALTANFVKDKISERVIFTFLSIDSSDTFANKSDSAINRLRAIESTSKDIIIYKDLSGIYIGCNPAFEVFVALNKNDIIGKKDADFFDSATAERFILDDKIFLNTSEESLTPMQIQTKRGNISFFEIARSPLINSDMKVYGLVLIAKDITSTIEKANALEDSEQRIQKFFESSPFSFLQLDREFRISAANGQSQDLLGYQESQIKGKEIFDFFISDEKAFVKSVFEKTLDLPHFERIEKEFFCADGKIFLACIFITSVKKNHTFDHYLVIILDVSFVRNQTKELIKAQDLAYNALRTYNDFMENISREIRSPLNAIIGFSEFLFEQIKSPLYREYVKEIRSGGKSLLNLVNDIFTLAQIENDAFSANEIEFSPISFLDDLYDKFSTDAKQKRLNFSKESSKYFPDSIFFDKDLLRHIISNIINNSIKFTESGFIKLIFSAENFQGDNFDFIITIQDSGVGISPDKIEAIDCDSDSHRIDIVRSKYNALGIGLNVVKRIITNLGGSLKVNSSLGVGSSFTVRFNKVRYKEHKKQTITIESENFNGATFSKALVISDAERFINKCKSELSSRGVQVTPVLNPLSIINIYTETNYSLIIIDIFAQNGFKEDAIKVLSSLKNIDKAQIFMVSEGYKGADTLIYDNLVINIIGFSNFDTLTPKDKPTMIKEQTSNSAFRIGSFVFIKEKHLNQSEIAFLLSDVMDDWRLVQRRMILNEIRSFGQSIKEIGVKFQSHNLRNYGMEIIIQADMFKTDSLSELISFYPTLIELLKGEKF